MSAVDDPLAPMASYDDLYGQSEKYTDAVASQLDTESERPKKAVTGQAERVAIELGCALLDDVAKFIDTYMAYPTEDALVAVTLWVAHCHLLDAVESTPRLAHLSPEPGSGKTRALEVLETLTPTPMHVLSASAPAIFRSIESDRPTLLFDEVDAIFGRRGTDDSAEDLRALLNAGHRSGAQIPRCVGPSHEVKKFPVFAAVALAGLGDLPDTLMSRSIVIRMRRRAPHEHVTAFRHRVAEPGGNKLRDRLSAWAETVSEDVKDSWPVMPDGITDRPADVWEPILAVADASGGDWPAKARKACVALCASSLTRDASLGVKLLTDLREIFGSADRLSTAEILDRLHKLDESPWADLRGKPLDPRGLAHRLTAYGITSTKVKLGDDSLRGYRREDLHDAWLRYCPPPEETELAEPTEPGSAGSGGSDHPGGGA
jgi:hypothetical protein